MPTAMSLDYAAPANLGVRHLSESFRKDVMHATSGYVAAGATIPIATAAPGRADIRALPDDEPAQSRRGLRKHYRSREPRIRESIERAGAWRSGIRAAGAAIALRDGTRSHAVDCGAPAFRFTENLLLNDVGPHLMTMVRNIKTARGGSSTPNTKRPTQERPEEEGKLRGWLRGFDNLHSHGFRRWSQVVTARSGRGR